MKLPGFGKKKKNNKEELTDELLLALDIGTEFVKAVLFTADTQSQLINIKGYGRSRQHSNSMQGAMIVNFDNVVNAADRAIGDALFNADEIAKKKNPELAEEEFITPLPHKVIMGIAGELVQGVTIVADYEREESEEKIDIEETAEVVSKIKEQAFQDAVVDIADEIGIASTKLEEINSKINATYIDGVKVDSPIGFTGSEVSYKIFSTFAPSIHLNSLKDIAKELGLEVISIEEEPYTITRAVKGSRAENYSGIVIDIGGGTTDVAVVDKGAIVGTKMFAYGGRVFTKRIAQDLELELNDAEQTKLDYSADKLAKAVQTDVKKALAKDAQIWAEGVELALSELEDVETYPSNIYLCGGGSALPEIKQALMEHPWLQVLPFVKFPKVDFLFPNQLEDINDETGTIIDPEDIAPVALARMVLELNDFDHTEK
ncbi:pilus assembly protein PilM [Candidatus Dojkabacteria bacterium]|uniref:Pilus assembly protein PilM n=1 Tax=Candidatus Dojkabacteria bacterium TaxID=2099670 RepID=A0A955L6Y9_9BACT|nr:pilus assembly protein PilM [Candidatus Dojkabacteria bacterium]